MTEYWPKNKLNYFVRDKTAVWVSKKSGSTYLDYLCLGNIVEQTLTPAIERLEHETDFKGLNKLDQSLVIKTTCAGKITIDELLRHNLEYVLLSSGRVASQSITIPKQESLVWTGATLTVNSGDAIASILRVRHLSNDTAYDEGVSGDYTAVLATGILTKTAATTIAAGETVLVEYEVTEASASEYPILDQGDIEVKMKWVMAGTTVTQRRMMLYFPSVKISLDGDIPFPKDAIQQASLNCQILEDETEGFGTWNEY